MHHVIYLELKKCEFKSRSDSKDFKKGIAIVVLTLFYR